MRKLGLLKKLAGTTWGADTNILLLFLNSVVTQLKMLAFEIKDCRLDLPTLLDVTEVFPITHQTLAVRLFQISRKMDRWNLANCPAVASLECIYCSPFFFFFCGRSAMLRPSVHMLPGIGWCGAGLSPFPTACWWLTLPAAITDVSVSARWDSPGGCGGSSVPLLSNHRVQSP